MTGKKAAGSIPAAAGPTAGARHGPRGHGCVQPKPVAYAENCGYTGDVMHIYKMENPIQHYVWGSKTGLSSCLGIPNPNDEPMAELWMGAHPKTPSLALIEGQKLKLDALISQDPEGILGADTVAAFGPSLPFLFKVLSADQPLSIQAHPAKQKALRGFEREELAGIPVDAADRNYRDRNYKPEMAIAITPFEGLYGFRPIDELLANVRLASGSETAYRRIAGRLDRDRSRVELSVFFYSMIASDAAMKATILEQAKRSIDELLDEGKLSGPQKTVFEWCSRLYRLYPGDIGALAPLILNYVRLAPGEAVAIKPGELHAHLCGTCFEIMANSDNVIRGGLTHKHVDVPELISVLSFNAQPPSILHAQKADALEEVYPCFVPDFQICHIQLREGDRLQRRTESGKSHGPAIYLCLEGEARLSETEGSIEIKQGESVFARADTGSYEISGPASIYEASLASSVPDMAQKTDGTAGGAQQ